MGKSSSNRKKRSKKSSQVRTKKGKSRSRKNDKSKKLHRRDDSRSYSSDDDSRSSMSVSCPSSEDDYRSRRARSRSRRDVKGKKKRARWHSPSSERKESKKRARRHSTSSKSREETKKRSRRRSYSLESREESPHSRKRILLKKTNGSEVRRKNRKKNKPTREASVSSMSSGSYSCDTCWDRSTSSHESEFERRRGRSERKDKGKGKLEKVKSGNREGRYRSRSYSSCSGSSEGIKCWSEEKNTSQNNVKRLRSVITVMEEENENGVSNRDENKEEIIYDNNDDYPSCRSNDSNDGRHKRELDYQSNIIIEKKMRVENDKGEELVSNIRATELTENVEGQYMGNNPSSSGVGANDSVEGKVTGVSNSLNGSDLESILRQRALENLRRFRGRLQTIDVPDNKKDRSDDDMKQPTTVQAELVQIKIPREDGAKLADVTQELTENPAPRRNSNCCLQDDEKTLDGGQQYGTAKQQLACATDQVALVDKQDENFSSAVGSVVNRPKLAKPTLEHYSLKPHNPQEGTRTSDELHQANLLMTESALVECAAKTSQTMAPSSSYKEDVKDAFGSAAHESSSYIKSKLAENASNKPQDETADSGQFEKKTMTVMRGGEMVQVSYKVYIPKKAPALARRQLKR